MNEIRNYKDLKVWQKAMDLADAAFSISGNLPSEQRYVLCAQIERSAISIPANIAEGRSRHSEKDFQYHLSVAKGSLAELETLLMLAHRRKMLSKEMLEPALSLSNEVMKMLHGLKGS